MSPAAFLKPGLNPYPRPLPARAGMVTEHLGITSGAQHAFPTGAPTTRHVSGDGPGPASAASRAHARAYQAATCSRGQARCPTQSFGGHQCSPPALDPSSEGLTQASLKPAEHVPLTRLHQPPTPSPDNLWGLPSPAADAKPSHNLLLVPTSAPISAPAGQEAHTLSW